MTAYMVAEIAARQVVHDQVEVLSVLEGVIHVHYKRVLQLCQNLSLVDYRLDTALCYDSSLAHFFHGEVLLSFFSFDSPYFAKATLADTKVVHKVSLRYRYN